MYEVTPGQWAPVPKPVPLATVIRGALLNALAYTDGRQKAAALHLGITPRALRDQMKRYWIPTAAVAMHWRKPGRKTRARVNSGMRMVSRGS